MQELAIDDVQGEGPIRPMIEEYYQQHPDAPRHDNPPHWRQAPPRHQAVRRR